MERSPRSARNDGLGVVIARESGLAKDCGKEVMRSPRYARDDHYCRDYRLVHNKRVVVFA